MTVTIVRLPQVTDLIELTEIYNHYVRHTTITFDLEPYSPEQRQEQWFNHYAPVGPHRLWVAEQTGQVVGYATSSPFNRKAAYQTSVETSIYVAADCHRCGVGKMLYERLFDALRQEDVHRAYVGITQPNVASEAFHREFGFEPVGLYREVGRKFDRYWDVKWFEKCLS